MGLRKIRSMPQHLPKLADRIIEMLPSHQQIGEIEAGIDMSVSCTGVEAGSMVRSSAPSGRPAWSEANARS